MKKLSKFYLLAIALLSSIACGSTNRTVQYVYVDNPVYSPAPPIVSASESKTEYVNNSAALESTRKNPSSRTESINNASASYYDSGVADTSTSPQGDSPFILANTYVYGAYRGYGEGESTSMTAAYKMATARANQDALEKIALVVDSAASDVVESLNTAGMESFKQEIKTYTRACLRNIKVVATNRTRGQLNRVEHCIEISAEDVIESLAPILEKLNDAERKKIEKKIKEAEVVE